MKVDDSNDAGFKVDDAFSIPAFCFCPSWSRPRMTTHSSHRFPGKLGIRLNDIVAVDACSLMSHLKSH